MTQPNQTNLLRALCQAMIDAVKAGDDQGAPGGTLYAAVMDRMTIDQFEQLMSALVATKKLRRSGHFYYFVADL